MDSKHPLFKQLGKSDDVVRHERVFVYAYQSMINDQIAKPADFENQGGWVRSIENPDFYFVYVADHTKVKNRYYLNTKNGHITKGNPNV